MPLPTGTRFGAYEILHGIGSGGMGDVYRARDTRLDRFVALKVLPAALASDPDRGARFEREAKVLAALNHPLIAQVYGFEHSGETRAIVMELVEGPTLQERIRQGPMAIPKALHIARQIAEALETAHELGIIHRDLKPANVKLKPPDGVKVLDFGLAKAVDQVTTSDPQDSPTVTSRGTEFGMILGTAAYMAPEQARGRPVDRRADVWAFGVVLYEMLTGTRLFSGEDGSDTLAAVLRQPIVLTTLPSGTPGAIRVLLARCLERDPRQRLRDMGEARIALDRAIASPDASHDVAEAGVRSDGSDGPQRLTTSPRNQQVASMHPSGRLILYAEDASATDSGLWLLPLDGGGTAGTPRPFPTAPGFYARAAFSPDGRLVAYMTSERDTLNVHVRRFDGTGGAWRVSTNGGAHPVWSRRANELLFVEGDRIMVAPFQFDGTTFTAEQPRPWSPVRHATAGPTRKYDLHRDGTRAIVATPDTTAAAKYDRIVFVFNFFEELRQRLP